jgi:hypothetical protein
MMNRMMFMSPSMVFWGPGMGFGMGFGWNRWNRWNRWGWGGFGCPMWGMGGFGMGFNQGFGMGFNMGFGMGMGMNPWMNPYMAYGNPWMMNPYMGGFYGGAGVWAPGVGVEPNQRQTVYTPRRGGAVTTTERATPRDNRRVVSDAPPVRQGSEIQRATTRSSEVTERRMAPTRSTNQIQRSGPDRTTRELDAAAPRRTQTDIGRSTSAVADGNRAPQTSRRFFDVQRSERAGERQPDVRRAPAPRNTPADMAPTRRSTPQQRMQTPPPSRSNRTFDNSRRSNDNFAPSRGSNRYDSAPSRSTSPSRSSGWKLSSIQE